MSKQQRKSGSAKKRKVQVIEVAKTAPEVKLDFGCGQVPREGYEGVDLYAPNAKHKVDLMKFPLPWKDESVDAIHCSHFLEHLPLREVEERDLAVVGRVRQLNGPFLEAWDEKDKSFIGKDFLFAFVDECYRILKPGGLLTVQVPALQSVRAFQDPTHRRFFPQYTFFYFSAEWRRMQKLEHYRVDCNFGLEVVPVILSEEALRANDVQAQRITELWNTVLDWSAKLVKQPPLAPA